MEQKASGKQFLTDALPELAYLSDGLNNLNEDAHRRDGASWLIGEVEMMRVMLALLERKLYFFQKKYGFKVENAEQVWPAALISNIDVQLAMEKHAASGAKPW